LLAKVLVSCPSCGAAEAKLVKSWPISFGKEDERESSPHFYVGTFECTQCSAKFRSSLESVPESEGPDSKSSETANIRSVIERINDVRAGLMQTLKSLREKIETLETERASLLVEIEELRKVAESRASSLETEVSQLRREMKSLRELLSSSE